MKNPQLTRKLASLTASLKTTTKASQAELSKIRKLLIQDLDQEDTIKSNISDPTLELQIDHIINEILTDDLAESILSEMDESVSKTLKKAKKQQNPQPLIYRRSLPFSSNSVNRLSVPEWAGNHRIDKTVGPFFDTLNRPFWFDIIFPVRQVSILRQPSGQSILQLPLKGFFLSSATEYTIPAGSIWILSSLLAANAPSNAYTGLRIKGGKLQLSSAPSVIGNNLEIGNNVKVTLTLSLDHPEATGPQDGPGKDAMNSKLQVPSEVVFVFTNSGGTLDRASTANVRLFDNTLELARGNAIANYSPLLERILFPFEVQPKALEIKKTESDFFSLEGQAKIKAGYWALDTAFLSPSALGEAANAGGIAILCDAGIHADWKGLQLGTINLPQPYFLIEPNTLNIFAEKIKKSGSSHSLKLWENKEQENQYSNAHISFDKESILRFVSIAGETDALLVNGAMEASVDKPVKADCNRIPLYAEQVSMLIYQNKSESNIIVYGNLTPKENRMSLALSNGLFVTTPPGIFYLFGKTTDYQSIEDGSFLLFFGVRNLIPALKDPYTSNFPLINRSRDSSHGFSSAKTAVSIVLLAFVNWNTPKDSELSMILARNTGFFKVNTNTNDEASLSTTNENEAVFLSTNQLKQSASFQSTADVTDSNPSSTSSAQFAFVAQGINIEKVRKEDETAKSQLINVFRKTAGESLPQLVLLDVSTNIDHLGIGYGVSKRQSLTHASTTVQPSLPVQIQDLELVTTGDSLRIFLLPQFQWEPVQNIPKPNIGFFPPTSASNNDGGPTIIGSNTVTLVPFAPEKVMDNLVEEYNRETDKEPAAGLFTLPFGMIASARFQPQTVGSTKYASLQLVQPDTADGAFKGGIQLSARSFDTNSGPNTQSPSFPGATYQTRNLVDPQTSFPWGISVLKGDLANDGVEAFFNNEMKPGGSNPRVPLTRIDFSGYGASVFSEWKNPAAVAAISKVHFETFVGRTGHEVVQVASILCPFAVPVVRTITLQRKKEAVVIRSDSGWVAAGPGIYQYPGPDVASSTPQNPIPNDGWTEIKTHPGLVHGCHDVRRIRETGRVIKKDVVVNGISTPVELLEVRYDANFEIEGVINGQGDDGRVPSVDAVGYVQRLPSGYPLAPEHLAAMIEEEGPMGADINCSIDLINSGQTMRIKRVELDASYIAVGATPEFAVAARGALDLPNDGEWTVLRHDLSNDEPELLPQSMGVPVIRHGLVGTPLNNPIRISEPSDLLQENAPAVEFDITQSSKGHKIIFPRPRIQVGSNHIESTERPFLADGYALSSSTGVFPKKSACFVGQVPFQLHIDGDGRYTLGPNPQMDFTVPAPLANRDLVNSAAFKITTKYNGDVSYTLDPTLAEAWEMEVNDVVTTMDLGPFTELMGISHKYKAGDDFGAGLTNPEMIYAPFLQPIVAIMTVLTELLGIDNQMDVETAEGSFKFKATINLPIKNPNSSDGYFDLGGMKIKGKLQIGVKNDPWEGFMKIGLGAQVPVVPPIYGGGEIEVGLTGNELTEQTVNIKFIWAFSVGKSLGPIEVSGKFYFGIELIISTGGAFQVGLLVGISATADIFIVKITVKLELMAAIKRIPAGPATSSKVEAIGKAKFAAEISICWFLTISVAYTLEYKEEISI